MGIISCFCLLLLIYVNSYSCEIPKDEYHEELLIKPLPSKYVYSYFQFTTLWNVSHNNGTFDHCHLFPRSLGDLVDRYSVQELHVSLTKGLWRHELWGYPVQEAPPGAELWAWFKPGTKNVDGKWKELTGALSGLLCASLNFIDTFNTMSPQLSLRPQGILHQKKQPDSSLLRYSALPREIVCTENLTPWKKLLPCNLKKGLSILLNSDHIYNTVFHSIGVHFRPVCTDEQCNHPGIELKQTVSLVHDLVIVGRAETHWSVQRLFGQGLWHPCPLAKTSHIYIDITTNRTENKFALSPEPSRVLSSIRGGHTSELALYDIHEMGSKRMFSIEATYQSSVLPVNIPPVIFANRYITGYGQEQGGIMTKIHNRHWAPVKILFLENIPWFVPVYYHTLKIVSNGQIIKPLLTKYIPGKERVRPYYLELLLELPPKSTTSVSIQFEYAFLKWQEYPPDANHGFYMGSASISALLPVAKNYSGVPQDSSLIYSSINATRSSGYFVRVTTEVLIISLPTPDFSMPYNVICLACTVVALAFGPLHNITTKRFVMKKTQKKKGLLQNIPKTLNFLPKRIRDLLWTEEIVEDATSPDVKNDMIPPE